jgi:hypothetical protein
MAVTPSAIEQQPVPKELRIALVCYGGSPLAIYMHGTTKEVHRLAKSSLAYRAEAHRSKKCAETEELFIAPDVGTRGGGTAAAAPASACRRIWEPRRATRGRAAQASS